MPGECQGPPQVLDSPLETTPSQLALDWSGPWDSEYVSSGKFLQALSPCPLCCREHQMTQ